MIKYCVFEIDIHWISLSWSATMQAVWKMKVITDQQIPVKYDCLYIVSTVCYLCTIHNIHYIQIQYTYNSIELQQLQFYGFLQHSRLRTWQVAVKCGPHIDYHGDIEHTHTTEMEMWQSIWMMLLNLLHIDVTVPFCRLWWVQVFHFRRLIDKIIQYEPEWLWGCGKNIKVENSSFKQ